MAAAQSIQLTIQSAENLKAADINGKSDPYVKFRWREEEKKTKVVYKSLNPIWTKEEFSLSYQPGKDPSILCLEIWDKDSMKKDDPLGKVSIDLDKLLHSENGAVRSYGINELKGVGQGKLQIKIVFPIAEEIQRILPKLSCKEVEDALTQFNDDKEKAFNHLVNKQIELGSQKNSNQKAQVAYPPLGNSGERSKPAVYTGSENTQIKSDAGGVKPAKQVIQVPNVVYAGQGRKKALLIGINYFRTKGELQGCIQDVHTMKKLLVEIYGFPDTPEAIVMLTDDNPDWAYKPIKKNVICAMKWLVEDAEPGDVFFFYFAGKGAQIPSKNKAEENGMDEAIFPCDYDSEKKAITDDEMHALLVQPLPSGSRLTAVMDCSLSSDPTQKCLCRCHTKGLDLPFTLDASKRIWNAELNPFFTGGDVQLFSAYSTGQQAPNRKSGLMTLGFINAVVSNPWGHTYGSLLKELQEYVFARGLRRQHSQFTSSQIFSIDRQFNLTDIVPNSHEKLGRLVTRYMLQSKSTFENFNPKEFTGQLS